MQLITSKNFFQTLENKHLLLDTSFFGDYKTYPTEFASFVKQLKTNTTKLITTSSVRIEFAKGANSETRNKEDLLTRLALIDNVVDTIIEDAAFIKSETIYHTLNYYMDNKSKIGNVIGNASVTDLLLATARITFSREAYLLSKNFSDFPFDVTEHLALYKINKVETYALY